MALSIADQVEPGIRKAIKDWAKKYHKDLGKNGGAKIAEVNRNVARQAGHVIYLSFLAAPMGDSYRHNDSGKMKRGSGKLKRLLESGQVVQGDEKGILFLPSRQKMDNAAKFWFRLNFGTDGGNEGQGNKFFNTTSGNRRKTGFDLSEYAGQGKPIRLPNNFFFSSTISQKSDNKSKRFRADRGSNLYPFLPGQKFYKGQRPSPTYNGYPTRQFKGHHFLEKGAEYINEEWPKRLEKVFRQMAKDSKKNL